MATTITTSTRPVVIKHNRLVMLLALAAILAPTTYLLGRLSTQFLHFTWTAYVASGIVAISFGAMLGIPIGLFFGALRPAMTPAPASGRSATSGNTLAMEQAILQQLRAELAENQSLFEARKGSTVMFARIDYIMPFWTSIKASGRLFVMQDASLLGIIGTAYYWLDQATHLERLAYEAKYYPSEDAHASAQRLLTEARLLDGQLENSIAAAISAIDVALTPR
jgi:hypothetical protein